MRRDRFKTAATRARLSFISPLGVAYSLVQSIRAHPANGRRVARPLAAWLSGVFFRKVSGQPCVAPLGVRSRLLVEPRLLTPVEASALYGNPPDHPLTAIWCSVLEEGDLVLDVGANKGVYSILAAEQGAHAVAIEPSSATRDVLQANLRLNDIQDLVEVIPAAVGSSAGTTRLTTGTGVLNHVVESDDDLADERMVEKFAAHRPTGVEEVDVVRIDDVVGDEFVMALKLDVEGQEEAALRGAERLLTEQRVGYLQVETNATAAKHYGRDDGAALEILRSSGYDIYVVGPDGSLVPASHEPLGHDVLAVPADSPFWDRYSGAA